MKKILSIFLLFFLQLSAHTEQEQQQEQYQKLAQDVRSWHPTTMIRLALCRPTQQEHDWLCKLAFKHEDKSTLDHLEKTGYKTSSGAELIKIPFNIMMRNKMLTVALLVWLDWKKGIRSRVQNDIEFDGFWAVIAQGPLDRRYRAGYQHGYTVGNQTGYQAGSNHCKVEGCETVCAMSGINSAQSHTHKFGKLTKPPRSGEAVYTSVTTTGMAKSMETRDAA